MVVTVAAALLLWSVGLISAPPAAQAATGDAGFQGPSYSGVTAPTAEKPESKLWYNDGRWWASMFVPAVGDWHIFYLDRSVSPKNWVDTGTLLDPRVNTLADTLWTGTKLYVASHVKASSSSNNQTGQASRLYRYSYDAATRSYTLDAGFPTNVNDVSSETLVIDRDSTGTLWATWTQGSQVYVNATTGNDQWGTPFVLPAADATGLEPDDISTLVAFKGRIGVMWSNQQTSKVYFSFHNPADPVGTWSSSVAVTVPGSGQADDHLNIKELQGDDQGRVFAVIKTSLDNAGAAAPQIVVLSRSSTGGWSRATFGTVADCHTRPLMMLDSTNNLLHVFATAPDSGCPYTGSAGTIFEKTSPMSSLSFTAGRGTPVIRDAASPKLNNVTSSKQTVNAGTGLVVLAGNDTTKRYWGADLSLGAGPAVPVAGFSATPTSGPAPLAVSFSDTSTGSPTSWAWDFGDGSVASTQNPSHSYAAAGTYTVRLTATNSAGSDSVVKTGLVSVTAGNGDDGGSGSGGSGSGTGSISTVGSTQTSSPSTSTTQVSVAKPSGTAAGDVLVASVTSNNAPSMAGVPAGWSLITDPALRGARVFSYYHVVGASEPSSYTWKLSSAQKWGAGMTAYRGVDTTTPLDTAPVTAANTSYGAKSLVLPSITTVRDGAVLIGGVGLDSGTTGLVSPPSGWSERFEAPGGQIAEQADTTQASAGASGTATWTLSSGRAIVGWRTALRPG